MVHAAVYYGALHAHGTHRANRSFLLSVHDQLQFRLRSLKFSNAAFRNSVAVTAAAALGVACGNSGGSQRSSPAFAEASADANESVTHTKDNVWYPNTTTKHWHFYKGKMNPNSAKSLKLFKCADTPIADEIAAYLGVSLNKMEGARVQS